MVCEPRGRTYKYKALGSLLNAKQTKHKHTNTIKLEKKNLCLPTVCSGGKSGVRKGWIVAKEMDAVRDMWLPH